MSEQDWQELNVDFDAQLEPYMAGWEKSYREHLGLEPATFSDTGPQHDPDAHKAAELLRSVMAAGVTKLADLTRGAVERLVASGKKPRQLFSEDELDALAEQIRDTLAPAELLGRVRILKRAEQAEANAGASRFSEEPTDLQLFDEGVPLTPLAPVQALDYFRSLVPSLDLSPERFGKRLEREAFTLAVQADEVLLGKVQDAIAARLETGQDVRGAPGAIEALLDAAGVAGEQGYAENVFRTNMMDSYRVGSERALAEVQETFPVWRWSNPNDGRSRPTHAARNGRYWPSSVGLAEVRDAHGFDGYQCRCVALPVDRYEWSELQAQGARAEE